VAGDPGDELNAFLASIERQAYRLARHYTRDGEEACDLVQEAMLRLAQHYAGRAPEEWPPLFFRILRNRIRDWQRREILRARIFFWQRPRSEDDDEPADPIERAVDPMGATPERDSVADAAMGALDTALQALPARQREVFLLRTLDGMDVQAAAAAMGVSEGSVKTHYSRAVHRLREMLGEH